MANMGYALGQRVGSQIGGYYQRVYKAKLDSAVGFDYDEKSGQWKVPDYVRSADDAAYGKMKYVNFQEAAYKRLLERKTQVANMRKKVLDDFLKIIDKKEYKKYPNIAKSQIKKVQDGWIEALGPKVWKELGIDLVGRFNELLNAEKRKDIIEAAKQAIITRAFMEYDANPSQDNLAVYSDIYAEDPDFYDEKKWKNPQNLAQEYITHKRNQVLQQRKEAEKRMEQKFKEPEKAEGEKPLTRDQRIDNTRAYYSLKMKTLLDEFGYVKEGAEKQYEQLTDDLTQDLRLIHQGKQPSYLSGEKGTSETITIQGKNYQVVGKNADGSIRIKDPETGRMGTYTK